MPSRDTLLGRMVGSLQSPLSGFARLLDAISKDKAEKEVTPAVEEKKEEVKTEEAPKEEKVEEVKAEEKIES